MISILYLLVNTLIIFFFREAILIFADPLKSKEQKDKLITDIKMKSECSTNEISPAWGIIDNTVNSVQDAMKVM